MTKDFVTVDHITRRFKQLVAVQDLNFSIRKGEIFGILGPDGTGKTTLLRMMAGVLNPTSGNIRIGDLDTVKQAEAVKARIGYMPQRFGLYSDLSVAENLDFVADIFEVHGEVRRRRMSELYDFTQLERFKERRAGQLSGGMKKKLGLACSLIHEPEVLLLDEPTTGVDPVARRSFWDLLSGLHAKGTTTIVSTPYMDEAERCNRVLLLFEGKILACDTPQRIKKMIPGSVIAIQNNDIRHLKTVIEELPFLLDIQTYGDQLNLIVSGDAEVAKQNIQAHLSAEDVKLTRLETIPIRMEEAFIYLVSKARESEVA
jgi:ABC-2 type transport system ATP-binding protein